MVGVHPDRRWRRRRRHVALRPVPGDTDHDRPGRDPGGRTGRDRSRHRAVRPHHHSAASGPSSKATPAPSNCRSRSRLSAPSGATVRVNWATAPTPGLIAGQDYDTANGTLVFAPGDTEELITITVHGDNIDEPGVLFGAEWLFLAMSAPGQRLLRSRTLRRRRPRLHRRRRPDTDHHRRHRRRHRRRRRPRRTTDPDHGSPDRRHRP